MGIPCVQNPLTCRKCTRGQRAGIESLIFINVSMKPTGRKRRPDFMADYRQFVTLVESLQQNLQATCCHSHEVVKTLFISAHPLKNVEFFIRVQDDMTV
jgi:hypothetical protein